MARDIRGRSGAPPLVVVAHAAPMSAVAALYFACGPLAASALGLQCRIRANPLRFQSILARAPLAAAARGAGP